MCVCVCECVHACVHAPVCARVSVDVNEKVDVRDLGFSLVWIWLAAESRTSLPQRAVVKASTSPSPKHLLFNAIKKIKLTL